MRYLILSDIHGNREALEAVLKDARGAYDCAISCGDLCDYGPDSDFIIEWSRNNLAGVIRGNHDRVCSGLDNLEQFSELAQASARWTMEHLAPRNRNYLRELPQGPLLVDGTLVLVHGSPRNEDEYVTNLAEVDEIFAFLSQCGPEGTYPHFFGHTHAQALFARSDGRTRRVSPSLAPTREVQIQLEPRAAYLINPGSVGQPRDGDPRAAYAIFDSATRQVSLRRALYDNLATEKKIVAVGLPPKLGARLALGR